MPEPRTSVFTTFSAKGYIIIAGFYSGLGPGLFSAGVRFLLRWWKAIRE